MFYVILLFNGKNLKYTYKSFKVFKLLTDDVLDDSLSRTNKR